MYVYIVWRDTTNAYWDWKSLHQLCATEISNATYVPAFDVVHLTAIGVDNSLSVPISFQTTPL